MNPEIKEYSEALEAHMAARRQEVKSRDLVRKTHNRVLKAKEALRHMEQDMLEDIEKL